MEFPRKHCVIGAVIGVLVAAWITAFFLKDSRRFGQDERRSLILYGTRRYLIAWALFGPDDARSTLRSILERQAIVKSVAFDGQTAGFSGAFSDGDTFSVPLPALPGVAFLPWWGLPMPFVPWGLRVWWKRRKQKLDEDNRKMRAKPKQPEW